jgi:hypothetical protein
VTFRLPDGTDQTAVVHVVRGRVDVADASLPAGWTRDSDAFAATIDAVLAVDAARRCAPAVATLRDVEGGWDVSLGNVVLGPDGVPMCTAHGAMSAKDGVYVCTECDARALLG